MNKSMSRTNIVAAVLFAIGMLLVACTFFIEHRVPVLFELPNDAAALASYEHRINLALITASVGVLLIAVSCFVGLRRSSPSI